MRRKSPPARRSHDNLRTHTFIAIQNFASEVGLTRTAPSYSMPEDMNTDDVVRAGQVAVRCLGMWSAELALALVADFPPLTLEGRCAQDIVSAAQNLLCGSGSSSRAAHLTASLAEALRTVAVSAQFAPSGAPAQTSVPALYETILPAMGLAMLCTRTYASLTPGDPRAAIMLACSVREVLFWNGMPTAAARDLATGMRADVESALTANLAPTGGLVDALGYIGGHVARTTSASCASAWARIVLDAGVAIRRSRTPAVHQAVASGAHARALIDKALAEWLPRIAAWTIGKVEAGTTARKARAPGVAALREKVAALTTTPTMDTGIALAECAHNVALEFYAEDEGAWQPEIEAAEALWTVGKGLDEACVMLGEGRRGAQAAERVVEAVLCDGIATLHPDEFLPIARDVVAFMATLVCTEAAAQ